MHFVQRGGIHLGPVVVLAACRGAVHPSQYTDTWDQTIKNKKAASIKYVSSLYNFIFFTQVTMILIMHHQRCLSLLLLCLHLWQM